MLISWQISKNEQSQKIQEVYMEKLYVIVTIYEKAMLKYESWKLFYKIIFTYKETFFWITSIFIW